MSNSFSFPEMDFTNIFKDFKIPGLDTEALLRTQQKNFEALNKANQVAWRGSQEVIQRQTEILRQAIEDLNVFTKEALNAGTPEEKIKKQSALIQQGVEKALNNMRELSEMVAKSNNEAIGVLSQRVSENIEEIKSLIQKKSFSDKDE